MFWTQDSAWRRKVFSNILTPEKGHRVSLGFQARCRHAGLPGSYRNRTNKGNVSVAAARRKTQFSKIQESQLPKKALSIKRRIFNFQQVEHVGAQGAERSLFQLSRCRRQGALQRCTAESKGRLSIFVLPRVQNFERPCFQLFRRIRQALSASTCQKHAVACFQLAYARAQSARGLLFSVVQMLHEGRNRPSEHDKPVVSSN